MTTARQWKENIMAILGMTKWCACSTIEYSDVQKYGVCRADTKCRSIDKTNAHYGNSSLGGRELNKKYTTKKGGST